MSYKNCKHNMAESLIVKGLYHCEIYPCLVDGNETCEEDTSKKENQIVKCTDIGFCSYNCAYNIMPPWVDKYVAIDKCLMREILDLWEMGIKTTGCCCGHGRNGMQFIGVEEEYAEKMFTMGYREQHNPHNPESHITFIPKKPVLNFVKIPYKFNWWEV